MEEFKFNSENSFSQTPDKGSDGVVNITFKDGTATQTKSAETHKKSGKGFRNLLAVVLIVGLSVGSGAFGAYLVNNNGASQPAQSPTPYSSVVNSQIASADLSTAAEKGSYALVAAKTKPAVVEITTEQMVNSSYFQQYITSGAGSGVIISQDGYIITNYHVINGATKITVTLFDSTTYDATLVGKDSQSDVAIIKIDAQSLAYAVIGDSSKLVVGEEVIAIGNPLGALGGSVTNGIISALDREITVDGQKMQLLQTNAAINPGNSGGGLFNMQGELVAIVNAKSSGSTIEGLGFAIPINYAYDIAKELLENGYVSGRPIMNITYIEIDDYMDLMRYGVNSYGIYVYDGKETELKNGDRIVKLGDYEVQSAADLKSAIQTYNVGDTVTVTVVREGKYTDLSVTLVESLPEDSNVQLQTNSN